MIVKIISLETFDSFSIHYHFTPIFTGKANPVLIAVII